LEQAAQESGGVTIPGGLQKMCTYGTSGHSVGLRGGLDDLRSLFQPMILCAEAQPCLVPPKFQRAAATSCGKI